MLIQNIIGEFEFMERHRLAHPLLPLGWTIRVDVHAFGHFWVSFPRHHPAGVVKLVTVAVNSNNVHQQNVFGTFIQAAYAHFKRRKHPPDRVTET